mmetsp:Transcript_11872/g.43430  ORF Transcript_11872/g.43430 Transcript_11872/m.43430 type:complete len:754 (-) Transcript_11872:1536-3797(-)
MLRWDACIFVVACLLGTSPASAQETHHATGSIAAAQAAAETTPLGEGKASVVQDVFPIVDGVEQRSTPVQDTPKDSWWEVDGGLRRGPADELTKARNAEAVKRMFAHAYDNYMLHAYPHDELKPISQSYTDSLDELGNLKLESLSDTYEGLALSLIESLSTLAVLGNFTEFLKGVQLVIENTSFDADVRVSVFETNIRLLGGLLSAHLIAANLGSWLKEQAHEHPRQADRGKGRSISAGNAGQKEHKEKSETEEAFKYNGELLHLAYDLGERLLPAFASPTGIPYNWVNLRLGLRPNETTETSTSNVGTLVLEFSALSRLTGDKRFEVKAMGGLLALWKLRSKHDLFGTTINVETGAWINKSGGIGAGIDSYFEYLLKAHILFSRQNCGVDFWHMFRKSYEAANRYMFDNSWFHEVDMRTGSPTHHQMTSLQAFWPGVQVMAGDVQAAKEFHSMLFSVWRGFRLLPERYLYKQGRAHPTENYYPLRPELFESTWYLYAATEDESFLQVGEQLMIALLKFSRVSGGFASIRNVVTMEKEDHQHSFFLSETCKYLYLLYNSTFTDSLDLDYVFSTEGHPLWLPDEGLSDECAWTREEVEAAGAGWFPHPSGYSTEKHAAWGFWKADTHKERRKRESNMDVLNESETDRPMFSTGAGQVSSLEKEVCPSFSFLQRKDATLRMMTALRTGKQKICTSKAARLNKPPSQHRVPNVCFREDKHTDHHCVLNSECGVDGITCRPRTCHPLGVCTSSSRFL